MFTTEHRPVPLPPHPGQQGVPGVTDASPASDGRRLPPGASHWSMSYYDDQGRRVQVKRSVPVNAAGKVAAVEMECPSCGEQSRRWLPAVLKVAPSCPIHCVEMLPVGDKREPLLPWNELWRRSKHRIGVAAGTVAVGAVGVTVDQVDMPWWGHAAQLAAIPATVAGSWWLTRWWLTRQARKRGALDSADEVAGARRRRKIGLGARIAAYLAVAATGWVEVADLFGIDFTDARGPVLAAVLGFAAVVGSRPYLRWVDARRAVPEVQPEQPSEQEPEDNAAEPDDLEQFRAYVTERWRRVSTGDRPPLPGTVLEDVRRTVGGWSAIVVARDESDLDPESFGKDRTLGRIARAYQVGTNMVSITADPFDANQAMILVQRTSPLEKVRRWDGAGINPETGRAPTATLDDGERIEHEFWRPGWGAVMELIAGCTGSGKSEYLNLLLAFERQSGLVVSWVCDPQMGQSLGDVRDGVDWFAPTVEELLIMLRVAVQVMLARNLVITRMRAFDDQGRERRVKYMEVSEDFPLLSITIDEAHIPMNDPDHGPEIVRLLSLLAKSGRKCNIKLRLIVQSPLLSELKSSVLRSQVISGLVVVFRTVGGTDGGKAWPGKMPADPANLPATWPDGSTAAGVGYMSGRPPLRMRADYAGDVYDLMHTGETKALEGPVQATAGVLYADRHRRLDSFDAMDPAELLGIGIPTITFDGALDGDGKKPAPGGRDAVLRFFADRWLGGDRDPVPFGEIGQNVRAVKTRALSNVLKKLVADTLVETSDGAYRLSDRGAEELGVLDEVDV